MEIKYRSRQGIQGVISWLGMGAMFEKLTESLGVAKLYTKGWFICKQCKPSISYLLFLHARPWSLWYWCIDTWLELPEIPCHPTVFNYSESLEKIKTENVEGILVVQFWPNQPWFPLVFKMLPDTPVLLTSRKYLLHLPQHPETLHPIWRKINLLLCRLAGSSQNTVYIWRSHRHHQSFLEMINKAKISGPHVQILTLFPTKEYFQNRYRIFNTVFPHRGRLLIC